jgi:DNA repair protein RadC
METAKLYELKKIQTEFPCVQITDSATSADFIRQFYGDDMEIYESMFVLLLNRANRTVGYAKISQGGITGTICDIKLVAKYAIDSLASSVILAHNHPSGTLRPSDADVMVTEKVKNALQLLDVTLLDHVILTADGYYAFAEHGRI